MRLLRFNVVAVMGMAVQLAVVAVLTSVWGADPTMASAAGVIAAVVHNFAWHVRWTWRDRLAPGAPVAKAFVRFAGLNGAVSLIATVVLMPSLTGSAHLRPVVANLATIAICGVLNYVLADRVAFPRYPLPSVPAPRSSAPRA